MKQQYYLIIIGVLIGFLASGLILIIAKPNSGDPISLSPPPTPTFTPLPKATSTEVPIYVQIKGEINSPGIYALPKNSRFGELINAAGGVTNQADEDFLNFALLLKDGDYIFIPSEGQAIPGIARNAPVNLLPGQDDIFQFPININDANQEALELLPGIGPAKAKDIIDYRQMVGKFDSLDELLNINGIGEVTLESLLDYLICEP